MFLALCMCVYYAYSQPAISKIMYVCGYVCIYNFTTLLRSQLEWPLREAFPSTLSKTAPALFPFIATVLTHLFAFCTILLNSESSDHGSIPCLISVSRAVSGP